jgi:hypothetical protein
MIVATFADADGLAHAQRRCEAARIGPTETYTPAPPSDAATGSPIPLVILWAGLLGAALSFGLQSYSSTVAWRFDTGGRPPLSWPSYIPTTFENGFWCKLRRYHHGLLGAAVFVTLPMPPSIRQAPFCL